MIMGGGVLRILQLCLCRIDADDHILNFYRRFINRGHQPASILPIFDKAITNANAMTYLANYSPSPNKTSSTRANADRDSIYFHILYQHAQDPRSRHWQGLWKMNMVQPVGDTHISNAKCGGGRRDIPCEKDDFLLKLKSRHQNLGNYLSYRKLENFKGRKASSFL